MRIGTVTVLAMMWLSACAGTGGGTDGDDASIDGGVDAGHDAATLALLGATCSDGATCESGFCVGGTCCDSACDGGCGTCGGDGICTAVIAGTECRASAGICDFADTCDGVAVTCPVDEFVSTGVGCRASTAACDAEETCTGTAAACPDDALASAGTPCGNYACSGTTDTCPTGCSTNAQCASGSACMDGVCLAVSWAFVTSTTTLGNLGGLAGADAFCQQHADAAGLDGTYRAWLADASGSPSVRFTRSVRPYAMPTGTGARWLANDYADLTDGTLDVMFDRTETGATVAATTVFTNVTTSGAHIDAIQSCNGWTSAINTFFGGRGATNTTGAMWTDSGASACSIALRLYCLQQ